MPGAFSRNRVCLFVVGLALAGMQLVGAGVAPAGAQPACYQQSTYLLDLCGTSTLSTDYEYRAANAGFYAHADGTDYLVFCQKNDLTVLRLTNPLAPTVVATAHIPWDWTTINTGGDTHGPYVTHIRDVATAGGFRYGIVSLGDYGWDFLRISGPGAIGFLGTGLHPSSVLSTPEYTSAALFTAGNATYAVAQKLDATSIANRDNSIQIYQIGTATDLTAGLGTATMDPLARIPTDAGFSTPIGQMKFWVVNYNGSRLLLARRSGASPALLIADVTTPSQPTVVNIIQGDSQLFGGAWGVDDGHSTVWVADARHPVLHEYKIQNTPLGFPGLVDAGVSVTWWGTGTESVLGASVSVAGNLLVAGAGNDVGYLSLAGGGQPVWLSHPVPPFTDLSGRTCLNGAFSESVTNVAAFQVAGQHYVCRSMLVSADIVGVSSSCISTVPLPDFGVTGGSASASCQGAVGYTQADAGFPGDTFTITDRSGGAWTQATLDIKDSSGAEAPGWSGPFTITQYGQSTTWTPPANTLPGNYYVTLSISGGNPPSVTKVITLCANPQAALSVNVAGTACPNPSAGCTALINDNVQLGETHGGTPSGSATFLYQVPSGQVSQGNSFAPGSAGTYNVGVVVPYAFTGTPDAACSNALFTGLIVGSTYYSCSVGTVQAGYGTASFQVEQPAGTKVADATSGGNVNVGQTATLKFTGRIASGYTPSLQWAIPNLTNSLLTCSYTAPPYTNSTCTIPANALPAAPQQQWNLAVNVCSQGGLGSPPANCTGAGDPQTVAQAPPVTVTPVLNSIQFSASPSSPNIGQTVTITLGAMVPASGYSGLVIDFGGLSCDGVRQTSVPCTSIFGGNVCTQGTQVATFSYDPSSSGQSRNITITGTLAAGGTVVSPPFPVTVGTSGSCPCPNVTASISGPTSAQPNQSVSFSASASAGGHAVTYAWTFGDGGTATGSSVTHTWTSSGTYTVRVTATSDCSSVGSANTTINIGGGGGGGNLTITPSPANPDPGTAVTFTFSPAVTRSGDSLTFNYGDGTATQTLNFLPGLCSPSSPCNTVRYTYTQPGTYTVTAGGTASGQSVSGSTQITVRNNCQLASAPVASFTWAPTQVRVGEVVQFTDTSTGTASQWSWSFGGPGTTSSIPASPASLRTESGTLTITSSPGSPGTGQPVTFTFSPGVTASGDSVAFDFGDGAHQTLSYLAGLCSPSSPCDTLRHSYTQPGTYTVGASGTASGQQGLSGSTTVTVSGASPLTITPTPNPTLVGQAVTFTLSPAPSQDGDSVSLGFGDGSGQQTIAYPDCQSSGGCSSTTHTYTVAGTFAVSGSGTAGGNPVSGAASVVVNPAGGGGGGGGEDGTSALQNPTFTYTAVGTYTVTMTATNCKGSNTTQRTIQVLPTGPDSVMAVDAAKVQGLNGTDWHADVRVYNPSSGSATVNLQFLPVGQDNSKPSGLYRALEPRQTWVIDDILQWAQNQGLVAQNVTKTALRVTYEDDDNLAPVVLVDTYNLLPDGSRYGQINSGVDVMLGETPTPLWLTGLHNNGLTDGFRTNYSIVNLAGDAGGVSGITFTMFDTTGAFLASKTFGLAPYGYIQDSIANLFGSSFSTVGTFSLKVDVPAGKDIQAYASVMDNQTGDPVMIPASPPPDSPIYLPAIGHLNGVGGTVWRADLQITNPDSLAHTWTVTYTPKGNDGLPAVSVPVPLAGDSSVFADDVVQALYSLAGQPLADGAQTSGIVRIAPNDGSGVFPIVSARAYNVAPNGTFGQGIPALWAAKGISAGEGKKLVLAGMSSQDVARTNVGFVNLSEDQSVNFLVNFYDEDGNLLNPTNADGSAQPLSIAIGPGTWDQDLLENRFRNAFKSALPSNLRAVAAEITVSSGGPGFAYATVIDGKTGDPNFIAAKPVP
jgi:PKD repeat protein